MPNQPEVRKIYCEICQRTLTPSNQEDIDRGLTDARVYVHDKIDHGDADIDKIIVTVQ